MITAYWHPDLKYHRVSYTPLDGDNIHIDVFFNGGEFIYYLNKHCSHMKDCWIETSLPEKHNYIYNYSHKFDCDEIIYITNVESYNNKLADQILIFMSSYLSREMDKIMQMKYNTSIISHHSVVPVYNGELGFELTFKIDERLEYFEWIKQDMGELLKTSNSLHEYKLLTYFLKTDILSDYQQKLIDLYNSAENVKHP